MNMFIGGRASFALVLAAAACVSHEAAAGAVYPDGIVYVNVNVPPNGLGDGTSWENAVAKVATALTIASIPRNDISQIWVAAGSYKPTGADGDRTLSFNLRDGLALYGGFAGGESKLEQRNPAVNIAILSGDLNNNDVGQANNLENSLHVVRGLNVGPTAVLDGFHVAAGNANSLSPHERGGGVWLTNATPTIFNCTIIGNKAAFGGGIYCEAGSSVMLDRCTWNSNRATHTGGAVYAHVSSPTIVNGVFYRNEAQVTASAIRNQTNAHTAVINCTFAQNNVLSAGGGAIFTFNSSASVRNTIMVDSFAPGGNTPIINGLGGVTAVTHSAIPGGPIIGTGNINPPAVLFDNPSPGNFRLLPGSPCIDAGDNTMVPAGIVGDAYDNARFANDPAAPDTGVSNGLNALVDMGAVERIPVDFNGDGVVNGIDLGQLLSGWGDPGCAGLTPCPVDLTGDGIVNGLDLGFLLMFWTF